MAPEAAASAAAEAASAVELPDPWSLPPPDEGATSFWHAWAGSLVELALILVIVFWMVGAWGRLSRLRTGIARAWGQLDDILMRRSAALDMLMAAVRDTLQHEAGSLQALEQAVARQRETTLAVRIRPHAAESVQAWVVAEREMGSPLARLQALLEQHPELEDREDAQRALQQLVDLNGRVGFGRQAYNQAAQAYNDALGEFPTQLLVPLFRLRPAATM